MRIRSAAGLIITLIMVLMSSAGFAGNEGIQTHQEPENGIEVITPDPGPEDSVEDSLTTRVIVGLKASQGFKNSSNFQDPIYQELLQESVQTVQDSVISQLDSKGITITNRFTYIFGFSAEVSPEVLAELQDHPAVEYIVNDAIIEMDLTQGIPLVNAMTARRNYNGSGLSIAICDTGIDYNHPRLGNGGFPNAKVIGGYDCGDGDSDPMDVQGHGTACAGIAAGNPWDTGDYIGGVAYNAKLYAVKISYGTGGYALTSDMIEGWEWCMEHWDDDPDNPIKIISTSFGGNYHTTVCDAAVPAMTTAADNAAALGITIFASSGNDGYCDGMGWPACISSVISVGAVYDSDFGNYLPCVDPNSCATKFAGGCSTGWFAIDATAPDKVTSYSNSASFLDIFAPANRAYTLDISGNGGGYSGDYHDSFGGTSAACPYAAGAAAVLQSFEKEVNGVYLTPLEVRTFLSITGSPVTDGKVAVTKPRVNLSTVVNSDLPTVTTMDVTVLSTVAASGGGEVTSPGSFPVTAKGVCWSEAMYPTLSDDKTSDGGGTGGFTSGLAGLNPGATYHARAYAANSAGTGYGSDKTFTLPMDLTTVHLESFETETSSWRNNPIAFANWERVGAGTPSSNTGPSSAQDGNYYMYTEASGTNYPNKSFMLQAAFDLSTVSDIGISFYYHMYGNTMGSLSLNVSTNNGSTWSALWSKSGDQGDQWYSAYIDLSGYNNSLTLIQFSAVTGSSYRSDIAIDNIVVGRCPDCSGDTVPVENMIFYHGFNCECNATMSLTTGTGVTIKKDASVTFRAPLIKINNGLNAEEGSSLTLGQ